MIKKLKLAAEFLGVRVEIRSYYFDDIVANPNNKTLYIKTKPDKNSYEKIIVFNPREKEGRHWLVEILRKFTESQWETYYWKMWEAFAAVFKGQKDHINYERWSQTAPSDICFDCIIEVIK